MVLDGGPAAARNTPVSGTRQCAVSSLTGRPADGSLGDMAPRIRTPRRFAVVILSFALAACTASTDDAPAATTEVTAANPSSAASVGTSAPYSSAPNSSAPDSSVPAPSTALGDPDLDRGRLIPGLEPMLVVHNDPQRALSYSWPVIPKATALNTAIANWIDKTTNTFEQDNKVGGPANQELNISWRPTLVSGPLVAIRFAVHEFAGANGFDSVQTFYANTHTGEVLQARDLVRADQRPAVVEEARKALRAAGKSVFDAAPNASRTEHRNKHRTEHRIKHRNQR